MPETYLPDDEYDRLVAAVLRIAPAVPSLRIERSAWTGTFTDNEVKIALGERLNVWPECIRELAGMRTL